jgi:hypothetical protein
MVYSWHDPFLAWSILGMILSWPGLFFCSDVVVISEIIKASIFEIRIQVVRVAVPNF